MKLILGVSKDGYFARSKHDNMSWLGSTDKQLFKMFTNMDGGVCIVSRRTAKSMPKELPGRRLIEVGREINMDVMNETFPHAWLLGGPTLALYCIQENLISEAIICESDRYAFPEKNKGILAAPVIWELEKFSRKNVTTINGINVKTYTQIG